MTGLIPTGKQEEEQGIEENVKRRRIRPSQKVYDGHECTSIPRKSGTKMGSKQDG